MIICLLHLSILLAAIAAAVSGLWSVAAVDAVAYICVAAGLRACIPERRAVLSYREIIAKQEGLQPMVPPVIEGAFVKEKPVVAEEQPVVVKPLVAALEAA